MLNLLTPAAIRVTVGVFGTVDCAALCLLGATAGAAEPGAAPQTRSELVMTSDLDLSAPSGRDALQRRLQRAAELVCAARPGIVDPGQRRADNICVRKALAAAVPAN